MKKTISSILIVSAIAAMPTLALADNGRSKDDAKELKIELRSGDWKHNQSGSASVPKLAKVESARINTYADVSSILTGLATTTESLKLFATTSASSSLSSAEFALLAKLSPNGAKKTEMVNTRADKILADISSLKSLVAPLGSQTVSTSFGLKTMIVTELNKFVAQINALAKLSATTK